MQKRIVNLVGEVLGSTLQPLSQGRSVASLMSILQILLSGKILAFVAPGRCLGAFEMLQLKFKIYS